jgi:hypothetical protein
VKVDLWMLSKTGTRYRERKVSNHLKLEVSRLVRAGTES